MIDLNDVLLAMSNIPVDDPIAEIWGRGLQGGYKIIKYTGSLPITINANGDALIDYKIYGTDGGVGVATESGEPAGYKLPMTVQSENLFDINARDTSKGYIANAYLDVNGNIVKYSQFMVSEYLSVQATSTYLFIGNNYNSAGTYIVVYNTDKDAIATVRIDRRNIVPVYTPINAAFVRLSFSLVPTDTKKFVCIKEKNVYIGENQLEASEYVSYSDGKIYRVVDGTLTPTDPPVPLPEIPTIDGTTVIDYDGDPKPSQMYVKYKGKE